MPHEWVRLGLNLFILEAVRRGGECEHGEVWERSICERVLGKIVKTMSEYMREMMIVYKRLLSKWKRAENSMTLSNLKEVLS